MNDRYDAGHGGEGYELVGYDEYGRPVYRQVHPQQPTGQSYDPYAQQGHGYDPYATSAQHPAPPYDAYDAHNVHDAHDVHNAYDAYDVHDAHNAYDTARQPPPSAPGPYDSYGTHDPYGAAQAGTPGTAPGASYQPYAPPGAPASGQQAPGRQAPGVAEQTAYIPQQAAPVHEPGPAAHTGTWDVPDAAPDAPDAAPDAPDAPDAAARSAAARTAGGSGDRDYRTEQFAFVEEPDGDSEDVIDWLQFTENRTERREEARRRARSRVVALVVVLALVAAGGVGYLWYAGKLPGLSSPDGGKGAGVAAAAQKRDVIVVHLHHTKKGGTSTVLLVDNTTTRQGTTVLLPNSLALTAEDGSATTLADSVEDDGSAGTREALDTVLGTSIQGTWRLDTPYLQVLVDLVGDIDVDTDTDVPDPSAKAKGAAPLVHQGEDQTLSGKTAVAYATYRAPGEDENAQLQRFGQVMQGVLRKISSDPQAATVTVQTLAQILDPSLSDSDLGAFLAGLSELAKGGDHKTALLPVRGDGTLDAKASSSVVKDILGGTAKSPAEDAAVRVSVRDASGTEARSGKARVVLLNGGFTFLDGGTADSAESRSQVLYAEAADRENAIEVAKTLGLPTDSVARGEVSANANVTVVLGQDYAPESS